jgi:hypothetical protein
MRTASWGLLVFCLLGASGKGRAHQSTDEPKPGPAPIYRVTVVGRTIKAINYGHRATPTRIDFRGTVLQPGARGEARVESRRGAVVIDAKFERVPPPARYGLEYLTYVLWAVTPEGRPVNLGEIVLDPSNKSKLHVSADLQAFALLVTAEPYYAVSQPSDVVVMENVVRPDTAGKIEAVDAKFELLSRGHYTYYQRAEEPAAETKKLPMDQYEALLTLYQARNAVQIARARGADRYAGETLKRAEQLLRDAETSYAAKGNAKRIVMTAREAAQTAEDACIITAKLREQERLAREKRANVEKVPGAPYE